MSNRIDDRYPVGQQIQLRCRYHPEKRWSTKNIPPIGSRTIHYNLHGEPNMGEECECSVDALEIVPDEGEAVPA